MSVTQGSSADLEIEQVRGVYQRKLTNVCSALGGFEDVLNDETGEYERVYRPGDECLGCLRDLKRFWRMDDNDENRTVARILAETNVFATDLLPILETCVGAGARGNKIALAAADLIGAMTWPIDVIEELREADMAGAKPEGTQADYSSLQAAQLAYKAAMLRTGALKSLFRLVLPSLEKERRDRTERDENLLSLVLHIIRNLAAIRDKPRSTFNSADSLELSTMQSELIVQLERESIFDLLLTVCSLADKSEFSAWNMVALDILHLLFRGVKAEELVKSGAQYRADKLNELLMGEKRQKQVAGRRGATRHSRFGTTVTVTQGKKGPDQKRYTLHRQTAIALSPTKVLDMAKKGKTKKARLDDDLAPPVELRPDAMDALKRFSLAFLDSSFFASVIKDITMERAKVKQADTLRVLVVASFFLDFFLLVRQQDDANKVDPKSDGGHDFDMIAELTELTVIHFVTRKMTDALGEKPPLWTELHAAVHCFIHLLLAIEALSTSADEEYRDVADVLQNKIYYQADILDTVLATLGRFKDQSKRHLDATIGLVYHLMRLLEKYSKNKDFMFVRKKRRGNKGKGAEADEPAGNRSDEDEADRKERQEAEFLDHKFEFEKFEARLADETVLKTLLVYLSGYRTFTSDDQMKRAVSLMHRIAIKAKQVGLFYKASALDLFRQILDDEKALPKTAPYSDLRKLLTHILREFFKATKERPLIMIEAFFPRRRGEVKRISNHKYASSEEDEPTLKLKVELEIKQAKKMTDSQRIGIAVSRLVSASKESILGWVRDAMRSAALARAAIALEVDGPPGEIEVPSDLDEDEAAVHRMRAVQKGPSDEAQAMFEPLDVAYETDDQRTDGTHDLDLKLLLRVLKWQSREDFDAKLLRWTIPSDRLPAELESEIRIIDGFILSPLLDNDGKALDACVGKIRKPSTRKAKPAAVAAHSSDDDDPDASDGGRGGGGAVGRRGRSGGILPDEEAKAARAAARKTKRKEEAKAYRSAQFVGDSDDEDNAERDAEFFRLEAEKAAARALAYAENPDGPPGPSQGAGTKKRAPKKKKQAAATGKGKGKAKAKADDDAAPLKGKTKRAKPRPVASKPARASSSSRVDDEDEDEETPAKVTTPPSSLSSPAPIAAVGSPSSSARRKRARSDSNASSSAPAPAPVDPPFKRRTRAIIDSDDE